MPRREAVDRSDERLAVGRRGNGQLRESREDDEAHAHALRLLLDERAGGVLRDDQPVGLDVGRAHRPRDVDGEDDRRARVRDAAHELRTAGGQRQRDEAGEQQGHREGAAAIASASGNTERSRATLE